MSVSSAFAESPYNFLRFNQSARSAGLSGTFVAIADDPSALYFNPASISTYTEKNISVSFLKHVLDINSGNASYIHKLDESGTVAGYANFTNYGSFDYSDIDGNITNGGFSASDLAIGAMYSNMLDSNLYYGVGVKFIYSGIENYSASALAFDVGLLYQIPDKRTNLGLSVLHSGFQIQSITGDDEGLPLDIRLGVNHRLRGLPLLINFGFHHLADETDNFFDRFTDNFSIGGEFYLGDYIQLRLGYDNYVRSYTSAESDKGLSGLSAGLGIRTDVVNFDYGIARYGSAATLHRFSLAFDVSLLK